MRVPACVRAPAPVPVCALRCGGMWAPLRVACVRVCQRLRLRVRCGVGACGRPCVWPACVRVPAPAPACALWCDRMWAPLRGRSACRAAALCSARCAVHPPLTWSTARDSARCAVLCCAVLCCAVLRCAALRCALTWSMLRNSKVSISNPKDPSTISSTRSATWGKETRARHESNQEQDGAARGPRAGPGRQGAA